MSLMSRYQRPATQSTCVICGTTFRQSVISRPRDTCASAVCRRLWISCCVYNRLHSTPYEQHVGAWHRPVPQEPLITWVRPDPPRPTVLPDGIVAEIVWSGDMMQPNGVKGGLLEPRRSRPRWVLPEFDEDGVPLYVQTDDRKRKRHREQMRQLRAKARRAAKAQLLRAIAR